MRRNSNGFALTYLVFTPLLLATTALGTVGCRASETEPARSLPRHTFERGDCGGVVATTALAGPDVREETPIRSYDLRYDEEGLHLQLLDLEGQTLGEVRTELTIERLEPTRWRVESSLSRGGEEVARQTLRGQVLGEGRILLEAINVAGENEGSSWAILDEELELVRLRLGAPTPEGAFDVLQTDSAGESLETAEIEAWMEASGLDAFEGDEDWQLLRLASNDTAWMEAADLELRRCRAFDDSTGIASSGSGADEDTQLGTLSQGQCSLGTSQAGLGTLHQGLCDDQKSPTQRFLEARSVLVAFGAGAKISTSLVLTGVVTTGLGMGVALVVSSVAVWYVTKKINDHLNDNKRTVVEGAVWVGGGLKDRNRSDNTVAVDFLAGSRGDPHLDTFDGLAYDLQSTGEFVLVRATDDSDLEVQVRQEPIDGICSGVSINTAVAARVGADRISIGAQPPQEIRLNGERIALPGGAISLPDGGSLEEVDDHLLLRWPDGSSMRVRPWRERVDLKVGLAPQRRGAVEGLLGNFNGERGDDLVTADGTVLGRPLRWDDLIGVFSDSWRVEPATSLFDYAEGEGPESFHTEGFPSRPNTVADLPDEVRSEARSICLEGGLEDPVVVDACTLDVGCTGDASFLDAHRDRSPNELAAISRPLFLDDWVQAGPSRNGNWTVSEDGRSVRQTLNGEPTLFISDRDHRDVIIRGSFSVDHHDDDFIGFVFGLQSPIPAEEADPERYDAFFFSWKGREQTDGGFFGPAGFTLYHLDREVASPDVREVFWGVEEADGRRILATAHASDRGWDRGQRYEFDLVYTSDLIEISIDGEPIFSVDQAESPVPFLPGRFGFYNYSQPRVDYGDFEVIGLD